MISSIHLEVAKIIFRVQVQTDEGLQRRERSSTMNYSTDRSVMPSTEDAAAAKTRELAGVGGGNQPMNRAQRRRQERAAKKAKR